MLMAATRATRVTETRMVGLWCRGELVVCVGWLRGWGGKAKNG